LKGDGPASNVPMAVTAVVAVVAHRSRDQLKGIARFRTGDVYRIPAQAQLA